jgi:hypothetical protein
MDHNDSIPLNRDDVKPSAPKSRYNGHDPETLKTAEKLMAWGRSTWRGGAKSNYSSDTRLPWWQLCSELSMDGKVASARRSA